MGCGHSANIVQQPEVKQPQKEEPLPSLQKLEQKSKTKKHRKEGGRQGAQRRERAEGAASNEPNPNVAANPRFFYNEDYYTSLAIQQSMLEQEQNKEEVLAVRRYSLNSFPCRRKCSTRS